LLAVLSVVAFVAPTGAAADSVAVVGASWFFAGQPDPLPPPLGQPLGPVPSPDVPDGDLPVAVIGGESNKQTFIAFDLTAIPQGSAVSSFILTLKEDPAGQSFNAAAAQVQALPVKDFWAPGVRGAPYSQAPAVDDAGPKVTGMRAEDGTWTFDLTAIVSAWVSGTTPNNGIGLVPVLTPGASFQVVWSGTNPVPSTSGTFTPPAGATTDTTLPTVGGGSVDAGSSGGTVTPAPVSLAPSPAPIVAPDSAYKPIPTVRPATAPRVRKPDTGLPVSFVFGGLGLLALLVLGAIALGPLGDPAPPRRGAVLRALEQRLTPTMEEPV
jgi:hypothetical protein